MKIHYYSGPYLVNAGILRPLCDMNNDFYRIIVTDKVKVTCKTCLKMLKRR